MNILLDFVPWNFLLLTDLCVFAYKKGFGGNKLYRIWFNMNYIFQEIRELLLVVGNKHRTLKALSTWQSMARNRK